jgi:hypothetical protein
MSVDREILGTATVECPNFESCGGQVTVTVWREESFLPNGTPVVHIGGQDVRQTCSCTLNDDDAEDLVEHAQRQIELQNF